MICVSGLRAAGCGRSLLLFAVASDAAAGCDVVLSAAPPGQSCNPGRDLGHVSSGSTPEQKMLTEFTNKKMHPSTRYIPLMFGNVMIVCVSMLIFVCTLNFRPNLCKTWFKGARVRTSLPSVLMEARNAGIGCW